MQLFQKSLMIAGLIDSLCVVEAFGLALRKLTVGR